MLHQLEDLRTDVENLNDEIKELQKEIEELKNNKIRVIRIHTKKDHAYIVGWADIVFAGMYLPGIIICKGLHNIISLQYPDRCCENEDMFRPYSAKTALLIEEVVVSEYKKTMKE